MSDSSNPLANIEATEKDKGEKGKNRLLSPDPKRRKFMTEILHAFAERKISFAELTKMDKKKIKKVAEMGYVKLKHGRYGEAQHIFQILTFLDHKNYFHHLALAGAYQKMNQLVDAVFQYTQALKYDPKNMNALVNRGEIYLRLRNYRKAAEDFREVILLDEEGKDRYANRARSLVVAIKRSLARDKDMKARGIAPRKRTGRGLKMLRQTRSGLTKVNKDKLRERS